METTRTEDSFKKVGDMMGAWASEKRALANSVRIEDGFIVFRDGYEIPLNRFDSFEKIMGACLYLAGKPWFSGAIMTRFVALCCEAHSLPFRMGI